MAGKNSDVKRQQFDEKKRKTIRMLIVVTVLFALSYIPTHVYHFLMFYTKVIPQKAGKCYSSTYYMLGYWLGISSCAYNPFIYCYFNSEFKWEALRYWRMLTTLGRVRTVETDPNSSNALAPSSTGSTNDSAKPNDDGGHDQHRPDTRVENGVKTTDV